MKNITRCDTREARRDRSQGNQTIIDSLKDMTPLAAALLCGDGATHRPISALVHRALPLSALLSARSLRARFVVCSQVRRRGDDQCSARRRRGLWLPRGRSQGHTHTVHYVPHRALSFGALLTPCACVAQVAFCAMMGPPSNLDTALR